MPLFIYHSIYKYQSFIYTTDSTTRTQIEKSQPLGRLLLFKPFPCERGLEEAQNILPIPLLLLMQIYPSAKQTFLWYVCLLLTTDILFMFQYPLTPHQGWPLSFTQEILRNAHSLKSNGYHCPQEVTYTLISYRPQNSPSPPPQFRSSVPFPG